METDKQTKKEREGEGQWAVNPLFLDQRSDLISRNEYVYSDTSRVDTKNILFDRSLSNSPHTRTLKNKTRLDILDRVDAPTIVLI